MAINNPTRPTQEGRAISVVLPHDLYDRLKAAAESRSTPVRKVTMTEIIRELIDTSC